MGTCNLDDFQLRPFMIEKLRDKRFLVQNRFPLARR